MKLLNCVLLFSFLTMSSMYGKDIYIDYNSSKDCMDSYEYAKDGNAETPYLFFHLKVSDNEKVILESGEDYTPRQYKPSNTLNCKDLERDEQFVSDINAGIINVFIVQEHTYGFRIYKVKKAEYYYNTSIAFGSRAEDYSYSYYYNQNSTGNLATKGSKADVFFEQKNDENCLSEYNFKVSADNGRKSKASLTILPEIGVLYKKADPVPPLARGSELELRKINDYNIQDYLGLICKFYGGKPNTTTANNSGSNSGSNSSTNNGSGYNPTNNNSGYNPTTNSGSYNPTNSGNTTDVGNNPPYYGSGNSTGGYNPNNANTNTGGGYVPSGSGNGNKYEQGTTAADGTYYPNYASSGRIRVTGAKTDGIGNWINPRMGTIYLDIDKGYYVNSETGQPANGLYGGNTYKDGYMVNGQPGPTRTTTTTGTTTTTYTPTQTTTPPVVEDAGCLEKSTADTHIVKKKETLFAIARTYGLSIKQLKAWNKIPANNRIYPCMRLAIAPPVALANTSKGMKVDCDEQPTYNTHIVQKGENLYSIARSYGVTFTQLKSWNGLKRNTIYPCTRLIVQAPVDYNYQRPTQTVVQQQPQVAYIIPAGTPIPAGATPTVYNQVIASKGANTHTVRKNETLYSISKMYGMKVNDLIRLNNLSSSAIAPGQVLIIAVVTQPQQVIPQEYIYVAPTVDGNAARREMTQAQPILSGKGDNLMEVNVNGQKRLVHVVREDETLAGIARYYNTSVAKIRALNDMDRNEVIIPFQRLYVE